MGFLIRVLCKTTKETIMRIRDLIDAVVSRRLVTLCGLPERLPEPGTAAEWTAGSFEDLH